MNLFNVYPKYDINLTKAEGVYVYDDNQTKYLDLYGGHGVISIGHSHPTYVGKLTEQLNTIGFYSNSVEITLQHTVAKKLGEISGYNQHKLFLCNTGAEANESALKLASYYTGKKKVVALTNSFHGRTAAALNITHNKKISAPIHIANFPVEFVDINNEKQLIKSLANNDVCAVVVEVIQGIGGLDIVNVDYLKLLRNQCTKNGALLIADEVQSGFGRSGKFFAHQYAEIEADIITMAKGMGNGFPVGGIMIHSKYEPEIGLLGSTFGGNHLACTAALAVLEIIEAQSLMSHVIEINEVLVAELKKINGIKRIKGKGLMLGVEFNFPIKELRAELIHSYKIFTGVSNNPNLLRILPPLTITEEEIMAFPTALKQLVK